MTLLAKRLLAAALLIAALAPAAALAQEAKRAITKIAGDLYRFQNNFHYSVFLVTADGVIVTDPINAEAATWLQAQIAERFDKPIKYLVLSHDHADHSAGGEVFADGGAIVIAHEKTKATIVGEGRPTAVPDLTFSDEMTLELGGKTVELTYVGRGHSDNSIVMNFPAERTLFAVDFISVKRLPYRSLTDAYYPDWIEAIKRVETIDFDVLAPGHGAMGVKADVADHRRYHEALYATVLDAAREGKSLDEMQKTITMDAFKDWGQHDKWLTLNIEGMHRQITLHRRGN